MRHCRSSTSSMERYLWCSVKWEATPRIELAGRCLLSADVAVVVAAVQKNFSAGQRIELSGVEKCSAVEREALVAAAAEAGKCSSSAGEEKTSSTAQRLAPAAAVPGAEIRPRGSSQKCFVIPASTQFSAACALSGGKTPASAKRKALIRTSPRCLAASL